jgi:hypothetical protein
MVGRDQRSTKVFIRWTRKNAQPWPTGLVVCFGTDKLELSIPQNLTRDHQSLNLTSSFADGT